MEYVFRCAGIVRGPHAYGFVADDLKKDDAARLYQWVAMLNGGVWKADVKGLPANAIALACSGQDPDLKSSEPKPALVPKPGDSLLLVYAVGMKTGGDNEPSLFQIETTEGPKDKSGAAQYYDRLVINKRGLEAKFRVLLLPVRVGDPLPEVAVGSDSSAKVRWGSQHDEIVFAEKSGGPSGIKILRDGKTLLEKSAP